MKSLVLLLVLTCAGTWGAPSTLPTPGRVREAALGGCWLRAMFHLDKCRVSFPDDLPQYSFAYDLHDAFLSSEQEAPGHTLTVSFHRMVNGTRLGLKHLAKRLVFGTLDDKGAVEMIMTDMNTTSGKALTSGNFSGTMDSGCVTFIALTDKGEALGTHDLVKQALTQGYDVSYVFRPGQCISTIYPADEPGIWSGHVSYFRMSKGGEVSFTRERQGQLGNTVLDVRIPPAGDALVTRFLYESQSRATLWQVNSTCPLGSGLLLYKS